MAYLDLGCPGGCGADVVPAPLTGDQKKKSTIFWLAVIGAGALGVLYLLRQAKRDPEPVRR